MKSPVLKLSDFLAHFAKSGAEAAYSAAEHSKEYMMEMFEPDKENGGMTPKMVYANLNGQLIEIPLLTLTPAANVGFKEMRMSFKASLDIESDGTAIVHNHKDLLKRSVDVDVDMTFVTKDPPEGFELLREKLNNQLSQALKPINE